MFELFIKFLNSSLKSHSIMKELYQLSDRELADLGINRSQIPSIVLDATKNRS
jgi:hypothetical protein